MASVPEGSKKRKFVGGVGSSSGGGNGFKSLGLSDSVYRGIVRLGFRTPTPVQRKALPIILSGVDTVVMARTGSGKTCAFLIPLLEKLLATQHKAAAATHNSYQVRGVILSPTRELSMQTLKVLNKLLYDRDNTESAGNPEYRPIRAIGIHGGESIEKQFSLLASKPDVIVATPGRLAHHLTEIPDFTLASCQICILDEADRLLEMGFALQIRQIAKTMPETSCQKVMLSATMPKVLMEFTKSGFAVDPAVVRLDKEATVSDELRIAFITCRSTDKDSAFLHVLQHIEQDKQQHASTRTGLTLVFAATRHHVEYLTTLLQASGISATLIYGTLDQEARKANLAAFKNGHKSVLVVTDVAARGIDVPLIDHVIHYHFPSSPKLFVHRSGRAARAGRIGFCWGLVEPDELPYMIDLHLFLGRKPSTGDNDDLVYTLEEMTPEMVHYGSLPESVLSEEVENVQRILNSELYGSLDAQALRALTKVCNNAMKQYRRTRTEASREGVRRAKAILEGERLETGQRLGGGAIPPHPLLRGMERQKYVGDNNAEETNQGIATLENVKKREEFLRAVSTFRPKETVFEAFATGGGKDAAVLGHIDKGRTTKNKKTDSSSALTAMKNMRRQMRMARDKGSTLVVAGSANAMEMNHETPDVHTGDDTNLQDDEAHEGAVVHRVVVEPIVPQIDGKPRMSKAERRRLKKNPDCVPKDPSTAHEKPKKVVKGTDFRDPAFFIENDFTSNPEEADRSRKMEAAMQPSSSTATRGTMGNAFRIEEAMMDIVGDENEELIKRQRIMRWDKAKRKYVKTTVGDELSGESKTKKMRLESGQLVKGDKVKLGELYAKWQKKTNRSVGRTGVFDDDDNGAVPPTHGARKKNGKGRHSTGAGDGEIKTAAEIKKERDKKQNLKIKNMKKSDRRVLERNKREGGNAHSSKERKKGSSRKK